MVSEKTVERFSLFRRLVDELKSEGTRFVYSHRLAELAGATAAQVRRDLMALKVSGSPSKGYDVNELSRSLGEFLDAPNGQRAALIGVGNLGRALLSYFQGRRRKLSIGAAFDSAPDKTNRVIMGCRCHAMERLEEIVAENDIRVGIITVPASSAQDVADRLVDAGVRGLVNFAPVHLRVPAHVHSEQIDLTMTLEKVAYFARKD